MVPNPVESSPVVVVGGGFGGLTTALALSHCHPRPAIVLIEPQRQFVFLPLLYELLSGEMHPWEVASSYEELLSDRGIAILKERVVQINATDQTLTTNSGLKIAYAQLVLSTGSKPADFSIPGVQQHALSFHRLEDVEPLRQRIRDLKQESRPAGAESPALVIVGAGPTGVELACKLADLLKGAAQLHLIELAERVLPQAKAFNRQQAERALQSHDVRLHLGTSVLQITPEDVICQRLPQESSATAAVFRLTHAGVIWAAGTRPVIPLIEPEPELINGRLPIDGTLQVTGLDQVVALGDASCHVEHPWPSTAQVALQQGQAAARTVMALRRQNTPEAFEFNDLGEMLSLGIGEATLTGLGVTLAGPLAFKLRRIAYLTRMPGLSQGLRSAGAWLIRH